MSLLGFFSAVYTAFNPEDLFLIYGLIIVGMIALIIARL